jgi:hypothetical protein
LHICIFRDFEIMSLGPGSDEDEEGRVIGLNGSYYRSTDPLDGLSTSTPVEGTAARHLQSVQDLLEEMKDADSTLGRALAAPPGGTRRILTRSAR